MQLDRIDRAIVALLQEDGRRTNAELAETIGLSQSACHRRIQRLQEEGVINGFTVVIDRRKVGLSAMGYVTVKMESHDAKMLEAFVRGVEAIDEIIACYAIAGDGDYILQVVAADLDAFSEVALKRLVRLPGVKDSTTNFVLSTVKLKQSWPI